MRSINPKATILALFLGLLMFQNQLLADVNVLIIGCTKDSGEQHHSGVSWNTQKPAFTPNSKPFSPTEVGTQLQNILAQDGRGAVNVTVLDRYRTDAIAQMPGWNAYSYNLTTWFHYPYPAGAEANRWANLRGQAGTAWDYVVLIGDPYTMEYTPGLYAHGAAKIAEEVAKGSAQLVLLMPWQGAGSSSTVNHYKEVVYRTGRSGGHKVAPGGLAWQACGSPTATAHPSTAGAYIAAASIYSSIYNQSAAASGYVYNDSHANTTFTTYTNNNTASQYTGTFSFQNPYKILDDKKRGIRMSERGTSTEEGFKGKIRSAMDRCKVTYSEFNDGTYTNNIPPAWATSPLPIDFNYGRDGFYSEDFKSYLPNPTYWQLGFGYYYQNGGSHTVEAFNDFHIALMQEQDNDLANRMINEAPTARNIPTRSLWAQIHKEYPTLSPMRDTQHLSYNLDEAVGTYMITLFSGRCPMDPKPAVDDIVWTCRKIGYETAWRLGRCQSRAPGFKVMPSAASKKSIIPGEKETMTVQFILPPQQDVTVDVSISNANAAVVGSKQLVFTPQNYNVPQNVVVAGLPGSATSETFNVVYSTVSTDEVYNGLSDTWDYTINRSAPVTLTRVDKGTTQVTANQNLPLTINLNTAGASSSNTTLAGPSRGTTVWSGSDVIYTPASDFLGKDGFSFATNNAGNLSVGYIEITVTSAIPNRMVSYRGNGSEGGAVPIDSTTYAQNATVTVLGNTGNLIRTGYNFTVWNTAANGSGTAYNTGSTFSMGASGVALHAQWIAVPTYTVTYNGNANNGGAAPANQIKTNGVNLILATNSGALTKTGYTFAGWNTASNGTGTDYTAGATYTGNANITLYAKWTPNNYTVTFNANGGGAPSPTSKVVTYNTPYGTLATVSYVGYTFNGWFTATTGGTQILSTTNVNITGNQTLYAQWTLNTSYIVSYNANAADSGTVPADQTKQQDVALMLSANSGGLARTSYTFAGWNTAADGTGTPYAAGATYTANADVILYAQWAGGATYTISYDGNGNTGGTAPSNQTKNQGVSLALATNSGSLTKTGSSFAGWNTASNGTGTAYAAGVTYSADAAVTLYAQWNTLPVVNAGTNQAVTLSAGTAWSPSSLTPQLWLDADDTNTITLNGATVSQWNDKSTFGRHATAAGTAQPTATAGGLNEKRVLTFDGTTDVFNVNLDFLSGVSHSAFIVTNPTTFNNLYGAANGSAGASSLHVGFSGANYRMNFWGNDYALARTANFVANSTNIMNYVWIPGTSKQILANGKVEGTSVSPVPGTISTMAGGGRIGSAVGQGFFGGTIAEIIMLTGAVNPTDREKLEGYLAHKWGLADNLDVDHPHKDLPPGGSVAVATLDATATDTDTLITTWSVVSGPASVTFANAAAIDTTATFTVAGSYTLRLTANDSYGSASSEIVVTVNAVGSNHSVTYSGNGNTGGAVPTDAISPYTNGSTVTVLSNSGSLVRTGYTFNNWNTAANGSGTSYAPAATFSITTPTILYAQWTINPYTITFDSAGGSAVTAITQNYGTAVTAPTAPTRSGYTFTGWSPSLPSTMPANNQTVTAQWVITTYAVTYNGNGSIGGTVPVDASSPYTNGSTVTVLGNTGTLVRSGYTFNGWNTQADGLGTSYTSGNSFTISSNTTLHAKWTINSYTITFDSAGGSAVTAITQNFGTTVAAPTDPTRTGYTFTGWNPSLPSTMPANSQTVTAQWTINTYAITYNGNGNTSGAAPANQTKTHDVSLTLQTNSGTLDRTGYSFNGWNTAANGTGTPYATGSPYTANAAVILYAAWTANSYTVTFDANSGDAPSPANKSVTYASTYGALATTSRTGYTFNGWFTAASGGTQVNSGTTVTTAANQTLYAQWTAGSYTVTFDANSGDVPNPTSKSVTYGSTYGALATTSRAGYTFSGWFTEASGGTQIMSSTAVAITSAQTLYAQWIVGVLLTWDANGTGADQTNGGGAWETANLWWNGTGNANWQSGASARFGGLNTAGGAVTLAAPTTVENFTFNPFTGTYILGAAGQAITLNSGINKNAGSGAVTFASPITLGAAQTWTNNSTGATGLFKTGNGTLLTNGGFQLTFDGTGDFEIGQLNAATPTLTGSGALVKNGTGRTSIGGNNTAGFSGDITINDGVLNYGDVPTSLGTGNLKITNGILESRWSTGQTWAQGIGAGKIQITGGTSGFNSGNGCTFNIGNAVWGSSTFNPTVFVLNSAIVGAAYTVTFSSNIDLNGADRTIRSDQTYGTAGNGTFSGIISNSTGTAGLIKVGSGHHTLSNTTNTYNGNTTISEGILSVAATGSLGSASNTLIFNGSGTTLRATGAITSPSTRAVTLTTTGIIDTNGQTISIAGNIGGTGGLIKNGANTLTLSGTNSYGGATSVNAGTLAITKQAALYNNTPGSWTAANINVKNGATLALNVDSAGGAGFTSANLSTLLNNISVASTSAQGLQAGATLGIDTATATAGTLTLGNAIANSTGSFGGVINLTKLGAGTLVLNQPNTYTGITTINAGTIQLSGSGMIPGPIINNGTLLVDKTATVGTDFLGYPMLIGSGSISANTGATITINNPTALQNIALNTTGAGSFILSGVTTPIFGGLSGATGNLATVISSGYAGVTNLTLNTPSGSTFTYGGVIANNAANLSVTKIGEGTQILQGANTYAGATFLNAGTLTLSGAAGRLTATSGITLNSGTTLTLINTSAAEALLDRVVGNPIISNGGAITVTNTASGTTVYSETTGALDLRRGQLNITATNANTADVATQNLTFGTGSLTTVNGGARPAVTAITTVTSAINFSGASLGSNVRNTIQITGQTTTAQNEIIAPWATFGNTAGAQNDYAVYNRAGSANASTNTLGVQGAAIAATAQTSWGTTYAAANNYTLTNAAGIATQLTATRSINSLRNTAGTSQNITSITANVLTVTGSTYANGDVVVTGTTTPTGLAKETVYYVVNASGATFQLAATPGGAAITGLTHVASSPLAGGISLSSGKNLETYGILNGSVTYLGIGGATGAGVLTTPTGGGNLYLTTGAGGIVINAPITDNGGAVTVVRNGSTGRLVLSGNNTFTGGLVVNGGIAGSAVNLSGTQSFTGGITLNGGAIGENSSNGTPYTLASSLNGNAITVNGPSALVVEGTLGTTSTIAINPNAILKLGAGNSTLTVQGVVSGSGVLDVNAHNMNGGYSVSLTNTANTFSGDVTYTPSNGSNTLSVSSIGDAGKVVVGLAVNSAVKTFALNSLATSALTFNTRQFELTGMPGAHNLAIANSSAQAFNINTDLLVTGTGTRTLTLQGTGGGLSTFAGKLTDGTLTSLAITKAEAGTWILSGTNNYTGITTVSAGTLEIGGSGTLGNGNYAGNISISSTMKYNSTADQILGGVISGSGALVKDNSGALTLTNANTYTGITTVSNGKLFINGDQTLTTGSVSVAANATLGGTGIIGGNTTIAASGKLEFNITTAAVSHDKLDLAAARTLTFSGASTLTITSSGGASAGIYTLLTAPGGITGSLPALSLPANWAATVSKVGNDLVLNVTSTGSTYPVTYSSNSATSGTIPASQSKTHGVSLTLASNSGSLTRTGYTFAGWNTQTDGLGTSYSEGASYTANADLTLYAKWTMLPYTSWTSSSGLSGGNSASTANPDGDNFTNLQEFAFGMNPQSSVTSPLAYVAGGDVTTAGSPILQNFAATGQPADYRAVFARRKDHSAAGLTYTVQFSADLGLWTTSATSPTVQTGAGSAGNMEAVSVPFPATVPLQAGGSATPKFFHVTVSGN